MDWSKIIEIGYYVGSFLLGAIPATIAFVNAAKNKKKAKTQEEKEVAKNEMLAKANELIVQAETFYKNLDTTLKATTGESAGPFKKESVMSKLQAYAIEHSIDFDITYWSTKIDEIVKLTKEVNGK